MNQPWKENRMNNHSTIPSADKQDLDQQLRQMNEALIISSVRQHELTEQAQKAESALRESEARFRLMNEVMPQKIFTTDSAGLVTYMNPQWIAFTGLPFEQLKGAGWMKLVHPDELVENVRVWQDSIDTGKPFLFEHRFRGTDGTFRWNISRAQPLKNEDGQIILWVGSSTDIDDAKLAEEVARVRLEQQVIARTADLLTINEQLQGFTYSVAHDLRQQIRGISSNASILMLDSVAVLDPESMQTLMRLVASSKKLAVLVDELLAYARLGKQEPAKEAFDLTALAAEVAKFLVERGACRKCAKIEIEDGLAAHGDSLLVQMVLENLLDNACKYSSETKEPMINIGRRGDAFFVRDNGVGFDMRFHEKLFQPFERLHSDAIYPGTGIGLANVKRIVNKHGGRVWAEGRVGEGATFYFTLG